MLALIGAGNRGTSVILGMLKNNQNVEVKYVCGVNDARGGEAVDGLTKLQGYAPKRMHDLRQTLEDKDVDAVQMAAVAVLALIAGSAFVLARVKGVEIVT